VAFATIAVVGSHDVILITAKPCDFLFMVYPSMVTHQRTDTFCEKVNVLAFTGFFSVD